MPVEFKDYYAVLGVPREASAADIKKAFRALARKYHPDVARDKRTAEEKFKELNEAYEVLGDPEKRRRYDELGARWQEEGAFAQAGPGARSRSGGAGPEAREFRFGGTGFSDFFEQFFGRGGHGARGFEEYDDLDFDMPGGRGGPMPDAPQAGADVEGEILVTLDEALHGAIREITVTSADPATGDAGTRTYRARIPRGVRDGQLIRLAGAGGAGIAGGPAGDLYLRARLARHPDYRVRGTDLHVDLDLAPWEAVLGARVVVPTLDGRVALRVPPGTTAGQQLRIRGLGLPADAEGKRGDLLADVRIQTPATATGEERALWERLAKTSSFNPRQGHF